MDKTIVVSIERLARHPLYKRVIRLTSKFKAHDESTRRTSATPSASRSRGRCRRRSAGASSRSWRAPASTAPRETVIAEEAATTEAIHGAAHPGRHASGLTQQAASDAAEATEAAADGGAA